MDPRVSHHCGAVCLPTGLCWCLSQGPGSTCFSWKGQSESEQHKLMSLAVSQAIPGLSGTSPGGGWMFVDLMAYLSRLCDPE